MNKIPLCQTISLVRMIQLPTLVVLAGWSGNTEFTSAFMRRFLAYSSPNAVGVDRRRICQRENINGCPSVRCVGCLFVVCHLFPASTDATLVVPCHAPDQYINARKLSSASLKVSFVLHDTLDSFSSGHRSDHVNDLPFAELLNLAGECCCNSLDLLIGHFAWRPPCHDCQHILLQLQPANNDG